MKPTPTKQVMQLAGALEARHVAVEVEYWDGHKHVDICVKPAKLFIEVNGLQHYIDPKQIIADLKRSHFSDGDDFLTLDITNQLIDTHLESIADAIAEVVKTRSQPPTK